MYPKIQRRQIIVNVRHPSCVLLHYFASLETQKLHLFHLSGACYFGNKHTEDVEIITRGCVHAQKRSPIRVLSWRDVE